MRVTEMQYFSLSMFANSFPVFPMNGTRIDVCDSSRNSCFSCGYVLGNEPAEWKTVFCNQNQGLFGDIVKVTPPFGATGPIGLCEIEVLGIIE